MSADGGGPAGAPAPERGVLEQVLAHPHLLSLVYQPIVDLERAELVGYEALARLPGDDEPQRWFELAGSQGVGIRLELLVLERVVAQLPAVPHGRFLSANLSLAAAGETRTAELVRAAGPAASRLLIELTDPLAMEHVEDLLAAVTPLRHLGVRIAVHVGPWEQAAATLAELRPDVVKVRSPLAAGGVADLDASVARYGEAIGAAVVVTVLEAAEHLQRASGARATLAQGYLLGRPDVVMTELSADARSLIGGVQKETRAAALTARRRPPGTPPVDAANVGGGRQEVVGVFDTAALTTLLQGLSGR